MLINWPISITAQEVKEVTEWQHKVTVIALAYSLSYTDAERIFTKYVQHSPCHWIDCYWHIMYYPSDWRALLAEECKTLQKV